MIGQALYLGAEALGISATGIGCFFDDPMHELLGLTTRDFQSLYHFTVGGRVDDDPPARPSIPTTTWTPPDPRSLLEREHPLERHTEHPGDAKRQLERRRVARLLGRHDRLPADAHAVGQFLLRHLPGVEAQLADPVGDRRRPGLRGSSDHR
jgi:hypothetical protein